MALVLDPLRVELREKERRERQEMLALSAQRSPPVIAAIKDPYVVQFSFPFFDGTFLPKQAVQPEQQSRSAPVKPLVKVEQQETKPVIVPAEVSSAVELSARDIVDAMTRPVREPSSSLVSFAAALSQQQDEAIAPGKTKASNSADVEAQVKRRQISHPMTTPPTTAFDTQPDRGSSSQARSSSRNDEFKARMETATEKKREADTFTIEIQKQIGYIHSCIAFLEAISCLDKLKDHERKHDLLIKTRELIRAPKFTQQTPTSNQAKVVNGIVWRMVGFMLSKQWETKDTHYSNVTRLFETDPGSSSLAPSSEVSTPSPASQSGVSPQKITPSQQHSGTAPTTAASKMQEYVKAASVATGAFQKWHRALHYLPDDVVVSVLGVKMSLTDSYEDAVVFLKRAMASLDELANKLSKR